MDGSPNYIDNNIINRWYHLFKEQNKIHSNQKYQYWEKVQKYGLTNQNNEKWKYIPLHKLLANNFINANKNCPINTTIRDNINLNKPAYQLVFINGFFSQELSTQDTGPWKIKIINRNMHQLLPQPIQPEIFLYLTECLSYETTYISLPNNTTAKIPLYLLHINQGSNDNNILMNIHYRHHVKIHKNSHGEIVEHFASANTNSHFTGARTSIIVDSNARIEHTKLSFENRASYHISHNDIHIHCNSIVQSNVFNIYGNHFHQHQTSTILHDKYAAVSLNSLLLPLDEDILDMSTYVKHNTPGYNSSKQIHKIISGNQGQGIFRGLITVDKEAIKINGNMLSKNLLLHPFSKIYSMPQLEIYADDVKCSHGATIGHINHEEIFYLCTRGIPYQQACQIIVYAFALEIIDTINDNEIQKNISTRIINILTRIFQNGISHKKNSV
ncbi:SufD family Fe-S cluster assembly protein [Blochmannia endosymbiont of Polyrhachis (Hedomyrma) turneri]|uniref:SufD family Fe-S cluster assembly protein n=1 Tax=Blochmannia endosymbiont of Polyrhachis (Hedomyrma) turneri TaxID=1505596 RepID=UPI00061A6FE9|nr:SufD family Fe-S cluster assembly protein [Blochmannia endosymbiont of Polyrhachis (Hedomyrma) turneri]AKC59930.1 FeS cluster assembly protein sufD [Blochmannia endosymbiont of Polyrhachis (Hedomyrma) turneri]